MTPTGGARRRPSASDRRRARSRRRNARSDLRSRILIAIPLIALAIFLIAEGGLIFTGGVIVLGLICSHELFRMYARAHPVRLAGFLGVIGLSLAAHYGDQATVLLAFVATIPLVFGISLVQRPRGGAAGIAVTMLGLAWIGLAMAHAILLRGLLHGDGIIIDVLVGTFAGDTGAYLGGRMFGATRLAPAISPNKTVEGLAIGYVIGVAAVWFAGLYQNWLSGVDALILGLAVCAAAPVGDLFESYLKRDAGTKDTGTVFGAHGGALDRLDAALFSIVMGFYVWHAML
jgi:phosphatidate cytidylyltransferase